MTMKLCTTNCICLGVTFLCFVHAMLIILMTRQKYNDHVLFCDYKCTLYVFMLFTTSYVFINSD